MATVIHVLRRMHGNLQGLENELGVYYEMDYCIVFVVYKFCC